MNILILTPIHPMQIVEMNKLYQKYSQHNNVYSVQAMALLAESTHEYTYIGANQAFIYELIKKPHLIIPKNKTYDHTIIYGNISKNMPIKFDHIVAFSSKYVNGDDKDNFDPYLTEANKFMSKIAAENPNVAKAKPPRYYELSDAHYQFPTLNHLFTFLKACGVKENDNG